MASTYTNNFNLELQGAGDNSGGWGDPHLNQNVFTPIDGALGAVVTVPLTNSNVTLTLSQWQNRTIVLTGTLSASVSVLAPLSPNSVGSATAVGGDKIIDNRCTGNFTLTIKTAATGSTGVVVPQGVISHVYSDTVNVAFADSRLGVTEVARIPTNAGSPNGSVTGFAGSGFKPAALVFDRTNKITYASTQDGTSGWVPQSGYFPSPQGYLTPTSGTPIIPSDVAAATAVYYTPYVGNLIPIYDGSWLLPYFFSELTLTLTSSQAANQIYDVFAFIDSGTGNVTIGTGPAWSVATAGSCSRGSGAGTTQLSRTNGLLTNTVSITARNGASTYSVGANQGTYLGSLFMDTTNGQVSCYRSYGQSRKWGIWNAYNRAPIILKAGDATASWSYLTSTFRPSNNNTANSLTVFSGLQEEAANLAFTQKYFNSISFNASPTLGIGFNSTSSPSGVQGQGATPGAAGNFFYASPTASYEAAPLLGINVYTSLEYGAGSTCTFSGTESGMLLRAQWRG